MASRETTMKEAKQATPRRRGRAAKSNAPARQSDAADTFTLGQRRFLAAVAATANITAAAHAAGVSRAKHYLWIKQPAYATAFRDVMDDAVDELELEARRRAMHGVRKPVFYAGKQVKWINPDTGKEEPYFDHEYSDQLLIKLLAAHRPEKYGTHRTELTGAGREPIRTQIDPLFELTNLSDEDLQTLIDIYDRATAEPDGDRTSPPGQARHE